MTDEAGPSHSEPDDPDEVAGGDEAVGAGIPRAGAGATEPAGDDLEPPGTQRRWWPWVAAGVAVVVLAGVVWAVVGMLGGGGPQPAEALPSSTALYVRIDLDPSAGQKIAALRLADRFPVLADVAADLDDDLKRAVVDLIAAEDPEFDARFDYEADFEPWLGDRLGIGVVLDGAEPMPLVAIQVTDRDAATATLGDLMAHLAADGGEAGFAFSGDYVVIAPGAEEADAAVAAAEAAPLADEPGFVEVHGALGDPGVASMWVGGDVEELLGGPVTALGADPGSAELAAFDAQPDPGEVSVAAALRLDPDHVELAGLARVDGASTGAVAGAVAGVDPAATLGRLPATTLFALTLAGFDLTDEQRQDLWDQAARGTVPLDLDQLAADLERDTGIVLPDDLFDLLSNDVTLALDASVLEEEQEVEGAPRFDAAVIFDVSGEAGSAAVGKVVDLVEQSGLPLAVSDEGETVVIAFDADYLDRLSGAAAVESLADTGAAERALSAEGPVATALYVDVSGLVASGSSPGSPAALPEDVLANLEALEAVGATAWPDDGGEVPAVRFSVRVTLADG